MTQFKISPLTTEKSTKKRTLYWLWLVIAIETISAGVWRLNERISQLEQQLIEQTNGRKDHVQ